MVIFRCIYTRNMVFFKGLHIYKYLLSCFSWDGGVSVAEKMLPLEDFLKLTSDEQVENLRRWKMTYTLKDIREAWNFKHSAQYYMLLKKLRIYERVVNKSDKFYPTPDAQRLGTDGVWRNYGNTADNSPSELFNIHMNTKLKGSELADKLERIAFFLKGENKEVDVKISIALQNTPENNNSTE